MVVAVSFLVASNVRADILTIGGFTFSGSGVVWGWDGIKFYSNAQITEYNENVQSDWNITSLNHTSNKEVLTLSLTNGTETITGSVVSSGATANSGWHHHSGLTDEFAMSLRHNNAMNVVVGFNVVGNDSDFVNAMFFNLTGHNNSFSGLNVTAYGRNAEGIVFARTVHSSETDGFFGFSIEDGIRVCQTLCGVGWSPLVDSGIVPR